MLQKCLTQEKSLLKLHKSDNRVRLSSGRFRLEIFFYLKKRLNLEYFCILGPCISVFKGSIEDRPRVFLDLRFLYFFICELRNEKGHLSILDFFYLCICVHHQTHRPRVYLLFRFLYLFIFALHWIPPKAISVFYIFVSLYLCAPLNSVQGWPCKVCTCAK